MHHEHAEPIVVPGWVGLKCTHHNSSVVSRAASMNQATLKYVCTTIEQRAIRQKRNRISGVPGFIPVDTTSELADSASRIALAHCARGPIAAAAFS